METNSKKPMNEPGAEAIVPVKRLTNVAALPEPLQEMVQDLLIVGATIEDVVEAVDEAGGPGITPTAVRMFYRKNPEIQAKRVMKQMKAAETLKVKLRRPVPAGGRLENDLTDAWLLTGLQFLNRSDVRLTLRDAVNSKLRDENNALRRDLAASQIERNLIETRVQNARLNHEIQRTNLIRLKVEEMQRALQSDGNSVGPELMSRIQEIYGLASAEEEENSEQGTGLPAGASAQAGDREQGTGNREQ
jgi:hypothetical protein